jgi:hypothetical protein
MQAPLPPQKKTAQKNKVWAKKTLKKNWEINRCFGQPIKYCELVKFAM